MFVFYFFFMEHIPTVTVSKVYAIPQSTEYNYSLDYYPVFLRQATIFLKIVRD